MLDHKICLFQRRCDIPFPSSSISLERFQRTPWGYHSNQAIVKLSLPDRSPPLDRWKFLWSSGRRKSRTEEWALRYFQSTVRSARAACVWQRQLSLSAPETQHREQNVSLCHPTIRTRLARGVLEVYDQPKSFIPLYSDVPWVLNKADDCGNQLTQEHHFPNVATAKTVAVVDFLPLVSLSFLNLSAQLAIICSTAVSTSSMCSCETYEHVTGWVTKYNPGPSTAASGRFPTRVPKSASPI